MPLKNITLPDEIPASRLEPMVLALVLVTGILFVLAPFPQLIADNSTLSALLATASISPIMGILLMSGLLIKFCGIQSLQFRKITFPDFCFCAKATFCIILCSGLINALWKLLLQLLHIPFSEKQALMDIASSCGRKEFLLFAVLVTILVPVAEELLFRRVLFAGLLPWGKRSAMLITSAIFAAVHLFLAGLPGLFIIGLGFQWIYLKKQNLLAACLCHALLNSCAVFAAAFSNPQVWK